MNLLDICRELGTQRGDLWRLVQSGCHDDVARHDLIAIGRRNSVVTTNRVALNAVDPRAVAYRQMKASYVIFEICDNLGAGHESVRVIAVTLRSR
jgi:hypothetical protein